MKPVNDSQSPYLCFGCHGWLLVHSMQAFGCEQVFSHYKLEAEFEACLDKISPQRNKQGRFILVTMKII